MKTKVKAGVLLAGIFAIWLLFWNTSREPSARDNPHLDYKGPITLEPIDQNIGRFFSYGFMKSTWLSGFDVSVHVRPQIVDDQQLLDLLVSVLNDCSAKISPSAYASEVYLSPKNPSLYYVKIYDPNVPLLDERRTNRLFFEYGIATRIKGVDLCNDEEKRLLEERKEGVVWSKSIEEILASSIEHSALKIDPELVFNFTDDEERRSIALQEVSKINKHFQKEGYSTFTQRMLTTGLRNKGALREWFFEYDLPRNKNSDEGDDAFQPEFFKQKWVEVAREILDKLNASPELVKYRENLWGLKSLRLNIGLSKKHTTELCYVTWSHFVVDYMRFSKSGQSIVERKLVKIPLDEFYAWAEAEIEKLGALNTEGSSSHL